MRSTAAKEKTVQRAEETSPERRARKAGGFEDLEKQLPRRWSRLDILGLDRLTSLLGRQNPFGKKAVPKQHNVWLLDNVAYRPIHSYKHDLQPWQAEFVACFFEKSDGDIADAVAFIADHIGLDGKVGSKDQVTKTISERLRPFVDLIAPARTVSVTINNPKGERKINLGPSASNGISSQIELCGESHDGDSITTSTIERFDPNMKGTTHFVAPNGWTVISDIDDTIKFTGTSDAKLVLRTTFADNPQPIASMPALYSNINKQFSDPAYFYLSASPYNLYPFLTDFLRQNFPPGPLILRENSWQDLGGILKSLTQGVQAYKEDRIAKIQSWLPNRKVICFGDSTQSDPEAYAECYKKYPGWIKAVFIRKVVDLPNMEEKNKDERFEKAFEGKVPKSDWLVFEKPEECEAKLQELAAREQGKK